MLAGYPAQDQAEFWRGLTPEQKTRLMYEWEFWAREEQLEPEGEWKYWIINAGRAWGKTKTAAETLIKKVQKGEWKRPAIVGATASDVRGIMVTGEQGGSGILAVAPPWFRPTYQPSRRSLTFPNGVIATLYTAEEPERLRGPEHDGAWCDELRAWPYPDECWSNLEFGMRAGTGDPQVIVSTTPKPFKLLRKLMAHPKAFITRGSTFDNAANLSPGFIEAMKRDYDGTRLGRQELYAEMLEDVEGALWTPETLERLRVKTHPPLTRIVVGVDPAVTANEDSDETGIVVAGLGNDGQGYTLADCSLRASPQAWASAVVKAYNTYGCACVVPEVNNGGDLVVSVLRQVDPSIAIKPVRAAQNKQARAEPIAALYEQGRIHHVGVFAKLEEQMTTWVPGDRSPDRVDAMVWAYSNLFNPGSHQGLMTFYREQYELQAEKKA